MPGIPASLFESRLFGHEQGAFTGATQKLEGDFRQVGKGTLIFDEVGELPLDLQPKLLRVLESRRFRPVGSAREIEFAGRFVFVTNRDLAAAVAERSFRDDLYHRMAVLVVTVPALDERREDMPLIIADLVQELAPGRRLTEATVRALSDRSWPGNVRELRAALVRLLNGRDGAPLEDALKLEPEAAEIDRVARRLLPGGERRFRLVGRRMYEIARDFGKVTELLDGVFRQRTTEYDNAERLPSFANQEVYPLKTKSVVEITPILEQPATTPGAPPSSANARVVTYVPTMALVAPTASSYLVRLERWSSVESEATVSITPSAVTITGVPSVKRQRSGTIGYDAWNNPEYTETKTAGGVTSTRRAHYLNNGASWLIGQLDTTEDQVWDANDVVPPPRLIDRDYDATGRLYRVTREPNAIVANPTDSKWQQVELEYDARGLATKSTQRAKTGEADRVDYLFYDVEGLFVEQTYNPAGHWNTQVFQPALGVPAITQDPNGLIDKFQYDAFGRVRSATPAGAMKVDRSHEAYQAVAGVNAGLTIEDTGADGSAAITTTDELGRTLEERHRAFDGTWAVNDVAYNVFGAATSVSRPGAGTPSTYRAQTVYDTLGRLLRDVAPDGSTSTVSHTMTSSGLVSVSTDADGRQRTLRFDLDDRVITKQDRLNAHVGATVFTQYTYQPFNLPEFVYDHLNHKTAIKFDALGRRQQLVDPDIGISNYRYNGFDEVKTETDGLGQTRTYYYDVLGRLQTILDSDGGRHFAWDTAANGKGKLARTESPDQVVVDFTYDSFSRPASQSTRFGLTSTAESFVFKLLYDKHGRPELLTYPEAKGRSAFVVRNIYNTYGYLQSRVDDADPKIVYWAAGARELDGSLKTQKQESLVTNIAHDGPTGRVASIEALRGDTNAQLMVLGYGYYPSGDLKTRTEKITGRNEEFVYDGLERLATWTLSSSLNDFPKRTTEYAYDVLGNLTTVKVDGSTTDTAVFTDPRPHAITSLNGQGFKYDTRGRQIEGPKRLVTYNAFDLPKKVTDKATLKDTTYKYDADENRVRKTDPSGAVTTYIDELYERRQDASSIQHVFMVAGEGGVAAQVVYKEGGIDTRYSILADVHGSVNLVVDSKLNVIERRYADPWGTRTDKGGKPIATASSPITKGFTGHEEEAGLALINMRGRIYDPAQRRFLTPDPLVPEPLFSQSYNRYSYVTNNPLRYTDPTGFEEVQTTNSPFTPPEDMCGGNWRIKSVSHGAVGTPVVTWKWVPDESPETAGPGASDEARPPTETELSRRSENSKQQLERDSRGADKNWKDHRITQTEAGFVAGVIAGVTPGAGVVAFAAGAAGVIEPPSREFGIGAGIGEIAGGLALIGTGIGGGALAVLLTGGTGGAGAAGGALVGIKSLELVLAGGLNVLAGAGTVAASISMRSGGDATGNKIPTSELKAPPDKRGNAPVGKDGHPVELHHRGQQPNSPLDEMTRTDHRGKGNFTKNHSNTGQEPSKINRTEWKKEQKSYWNEEWDSGRFEDM